jgi:hypothetical protein
MIIEGAANTEIFEISIEQSLAPSLESGQIVIMDTLSIHKSVKARKIIEDHEGQLLFLPPCMPLCLCSRSIFYRSINSFSDSGIIIFSMSSPTNTSSSRFTEEMCSPSDPL